MRLEMEAGITLTHDKSEEQTMLVAIARKVSHNVAYRVSCEVRRGEARRGEALT